MKKKRLFMNLKKKLAVFMSLSSLLNTSTIKGANDINYDHSSENFDYEEEDNDDDLIESLKLPPMDWWHEILKIDPTAAGVAGLVLAESARRKIYENSIVVPKSLPKEEKNIDPAPLSNKVNEQIEWSNSMSWNDLVKKSQDLWKQQGYVFKHEDTPHNMAIKAILKSNETVYNKPFHVPNGMLGPIYAVQKSEIEKKYGNNQEAINRNITSLKNGKVPLCDDKNLLVNSRFELTQILVAMLQKLQNYMNEKHKIKNIKGNNTKLLSLGDILYMFNKLLDKLNQAKHKSPIITASWFFLGANKDNQNKQLSEGLAPCMDLITNLLPMLGLYGMQVPGRYVGGLNRLPVLGDLIQFYNEQCKWDFAIPIRSVNGNEVIYQIGNTSVTLNKHSNNVKNYHSPINFDNLKVVGTDLGGQGWINGALVGAGNLYMNNWNNILGMSNVKDFAAVFTTRLAVYTSRLEPLIKFIGCLDDMYQKSKGNIESLLRNVEKLTGENESIKTARQIITEYSPESEKGKILRQLLDLFKRNYEDSTLDNMLQNVNYFKNNLPTVFNDYDEKAVKQKEINYIKKLNDDKEKPEAERELCYCSLQELNNRLNNVTKESKDEYNIYYELANRCVSSGRADKITLAYIYKKYMGYTDLGSDYPKAIRALKRLIIRSLNLYPWKDFTPIHNRLTQDNKTTHDELAQLKQRVNDFRSHEDWNEYTSLKNLTEFYVEEGAFDTKILEPINFIEKRYIGVLRNQLTSDYPKAIKALKHIIKCYWNEHKCDELKFIDDQYDGNTELQKLKEEVIKQKSKNDYYEYKALDNLTEFYALEGLLEPQILERLDFIKGKYVGNGWYGTDYPAAIRAVKYLINRGYNANKCKELEFIKGQYNNGEELKKLENEITSNNGKNNWEEYKTLEKLAEFYVLNGSLEPKFSETLDFIKKKNIGGKWFFGDYTNAIQAILRLLKRHVNLDEEPGSLIKDRYDENSADAKLNELKNNISIYQGNNDWYECDALKKLAEFYIEEGLLQPQILDEADEKIDKGYLQNGYSNAIKFFQDELKKVKYD